MFLTRLLLALITAALGSFSLGLTSCSTPSNPDGNDYYENLPDYMDRRIPSRRS